MLLLKLQIRLKDFNMKEVTFLGLGYIGLPTAPICASAEQKVFGFDVDNKK